ncbi:hypothetical protein EMPG_14619 [Blastomyces silverae]|uniref:Uncharacterized protein n=1 Tax=Blastomyces silverae TaxID=2060906 RepID=A0A0H1BFT7_9EURO|nr:hypothetical protein EMPG_14619 [Blastomyces silverae]
MLEQLSYDVSGITKFSALCHHRPTLFLYTEYMLAIDSIEANGLLHFSGAGAESALEAWADDVVEVRETGLGAGTLGRSDISAGGHSAGGTCHFISVLAAFSLTSRKPHKKEKSNALETKL